MFRFLAKPTAQDLQLGQLQLRHGYWTSVAIPSAIGKVVVKVEGQKSGPEHAALHHAYRVLSEIGSYINRAIKYVNSKPLPQTAPNISNPVLETLTTHASGRLSIHFSLPMYGELVVYFENDVPCDFSLRD
jgi:hypothetical protein